MAKKKKQKDEIKSSPFLKGISVVYIFIALISGYFSIMYYGEGGQEWPVNPTLYSGVLGVALFIENLGAGILGVIWKVKPDVIPTVIIALGVLEIVYSAACMIMGNGLETGVLLPVLLIIGGVRQKMYVEQYKERQMYRS